MIIHASSFGSIERTLCALLENIAHDERLGSPPMLPVWLAPTQVRLLPVSETYVPAAAQLCERITREGIRADVDDRSDTVGKKIRGAEEEWVPYVIVFGAREMQSEELNVRLRREGCQRPMTVQSLIESIEGETREMPRRPIPLPVFLSQRPTFFG